MLKFRTGSGATDDTGYDDADSIRPPVNGADLVSATTSGRFLGNLRKRTEAIRTAWDLGEMAAYHDRGLVIVPTAGVTDDGGPTCTWAGTVAGGGGGTGQPALSASVSVKSAGSPSSNAYPEIRHTTVGGSSLRIVSSTWSGALRTDRDMVAGGRNISLELVLGSVGVPAAAAVEGAADPADGPTAVVVTYEDDGGGGCATTYDELESAINSAVGNTNGEVLFADLSAPDANPLAPAFVAELSTRSKLFGFSTYGTGGVDSISTLVSEAAIQAEGPYAEGDLCILDFDENAERLSPSSGSYVARIYGGSTAVVHSNVGKGGAIPLFMVKDNTLIWFNGVVCPKDIPTELVTQSGLRAELANEDNTSALGASGSERIGSEDVALGWGPSLVHDTVHAQIAALYQTSAETVVLVDPVAGVGHFQTIAAAVTALAAADGGIIIVNPGTYTDAVNISSSHEGITIIGRDPATTVLAGAGAVPLTISTDAACYIKNLTIARNNTSGEAIVMDCATPESGLVQKFENCNIIRLGVPVGAVTLITSEAPAEFLRCSFLSLSAVYETVLTMATGGALLANTYFRGCTFDTVNKIVASGGAANVAEVLEVSDCVIKDCASNTVEEPLINISTGTIDSAVISRNCWNTGAAANSGLFCNLSVNEKAVVEDNQLLRCPDSALSADAAVIEIASLGNYLRQTAVVRGNNLQGLTTGKIVCGGILVTDAHARIENNNIQAGHSRAGDQAIGFEEGSADGNVVGTSSSTAGVIYIRADLGGGAKHVSITNNKIYGALSNTQIGISVASTAVSCRISRNTVFSTQTNGTAKGIVCDSPNAVVGDNHLNNLQLGVESIALGVRVHDNYIKCTSAALAIGVFVDSAFNVVRGNIIEFESLVQPDAVGIDLDSGTNAKIEDNHIGYTSSAPGIGINISDVAIVRGNQVYARAQTISPIGINVAANDCVIADNSVDVTQTGAGAAFDVYGVKNTGDRVTITGNRIAATNDNVGAGRSEYGVHTDAQDGNISINTIVTTLTGVDGGTGHGIYFDGAGAIQNGCGGNRITAEEPVTENLANDNGIGNVADGTGTATLLTEQAYVDLS